jgi:hypothetical protein
MMTDDEKAALADVYEKAAEYLEEYGWIQGDLGHQGGPRCFVGALRSANEALETQARIMAEDVLELSNHCYIRICSCGGAMAMWNDEEDRTSDEVINTLRALANKLR